MRQIALSLVLGSLSTLVVVSLYWATLLSGIVTAEARSITFVALIAANSMLIFSSRSAQTGLRQTLRSGNRVSYWVLSGTLLGLLAVTRVPLFADSFAFAPTSWLRWLAAAAIGASAFILFEAAKWIAAQVQGPR